MKIRKIVFILFIALTSTIFANNTIGWPGGRLVITSDGNRHDVDDTGAMPMCAAMLYYTGYINKLVHFDYSNHLGESITEKHNDMVDSFEGIKSYFDVSDSKIFNCQTQLSDAITNFVKEAKKSSSQNPLWIVCAGPMATTYLYLEAISKADKSKLKYIHCISHSNANNIHNDTPELSGKTWIILKELYPMVNFHDIANQNKAVGFNSPINNWSWLNSDSSPEAWKWLFSRNRTASVNNGNFDMSDGGMIYWLLTCKKENGIYKGNEKGNWEDIKNLFNTYQNKITK
jgi:hypothetical protein